MLLMQGARKVSSGQGSYLCRVSLALQQGFFLLILCKKISSNSVTWALKLITSVLSIWLSLTYPIISSLHFLSMNICCVSHLVSKLSPGGCCCCTGVIYEDTKCCLTAAAASQSQRASSEEVWLKVTVLRRHHHPGNNDLAVF